MTWHRRPATVVALAVATLAAAAPLAQPPRPPAPHSTLGFAPCSDYKLATYEQIADYFRELDASSDRLQLVDIGRTAEGRTQLLAVISSEENLRALARYKGIARRLALAEGLTDAEARSLARQGKAVVWIDFGLHSTEVAHGQTAPLMAWKAVTEESDEMRFIRDNVIFVLVPNMNPDGTTLVANWYMGHVGTPYERSSPPELYHKYVGHDNNRDWFMFNMPESRNIARQLYVEWFPQIVYDQHQAAPFPARIFLPPYEDPMNPNIPPLVMRGINLVGSAMGRRFDQEGKAGAISRLQFDAWWNGGMRSAPYFHNMVGILTETAHSSATPAVYDPRTFPKTFANGVPTLEPSTDYPRPYRGGEWHLRDSCDYMVTGSMAVLDIGATRREEWLYDIYQMGRDARRAGASETYVIPTDQWDGGAAVRMVNTLRLGGIEVERAAAPFSAGGRTYAAGSYLIRGAQPFRAHLTDMLNPQVYPDRRLSPGGPPERPYDVTGWTLPMQMGVRVDRLAEAVGVATSRVDIATAAGGGVSGQTSVAYALDPRTNEAFIAVNRLLAAGEAVSRTRDTLTAAGRQWPAGTWIVHAGPKTAARVDEATKAAGIEAVALSGTPSIEMQHVRPPRIGLYHGWGGNADEGWTRWLLEQYGFAYRLVHDGDVRAGNLRAALDVLVLPDTTYQNMLGGLAPGTTPPEYTGGMTPKGVANVYQFAAAGGTLVALDGATELPLVLFGLPVRNVTANQREEDFYIPGTLLKIAVDTRHPVAYGMPSESAAFFVHSSAFAVGRSRTRDQQQRGVTPPDPEGIDIVARYADEGLLMSGWALGEGLISGRAAVVDAKVDKGRVVLLGFRTQHRGQSHATFKLLFNSLYLGTMGAAPAGTASLGGR